MDLSIIFGSIFDLVKLLLLASIIGFILFKIFSPLRKKLEEKYSLSWIKSCLAINFSAFFILIFIAFVYFMLIGYLDAPLRDPETEYTIFENVMLVLIAVPRMIIASVILSFLFLFFELVASMFMGEVSKKKSSRGWGKEFFGISISSLLFILLLLFVFQWVPLGLFIYVFFGSTKALPLLIFLVN